MTLNCRYPAMISAINLPTQKYRYCKRITDLVLVVLSAIYLQLNKYLIQCDILNVSVLQHEVAYAKE